jgi:hypothetical protein
MIFKVEKRRISQEWSASFDTGILSSIPDRRNACGPLEVTWRHGQAGRR